MVGSFKKIISNYKTFIGVIISLSLLCLTIKQSHLSVLSLKLNSHQEKLFILSVAIFVFTTLIQAQRTKFIWIDKFKELSKIKMYDSIILGNFYNCILPGNIGEGIRAWHFHRRNNISFLNSISAIILEKIVDAQLFIPVIIILNLLHTPSRSDYIIIILDIIVLVIVVCDIFLIAIFMSNRFKKGLFSLIPSVHLRARIFKVFIYFKSHIIRLYETRWLLIYAPLGYGLFGLNILQYGVLLEAVYIGPPILGIYSLLLLSCSMVVFSFLPSAPSNIGIVHYGIYYALCHSATLFGVNTNIPMLQKFALMGILLHASYFLPETILGVFFLFKERKWWL